MGTSASTSLNVNDMTNTMITVLTKPSEASFEAAKGHVNTVGTVVAVAISGAIAGFLSGRDNGIGGMVGGLVAGAILGPIGYYIGQAILWLIAKLFGGKGPLMLQADLLATFYAPITVVNAILGLIPFVGPVLGIVVTIYELVLLTFGLKVTHEYSTGKAVLTWLIPGIVVAIIALLVAGAAVLALIGMGAAGQ
jgi:hypothetical protein